MGVEVSVCGAGKRFFWCVVDGESGEPLAHGHAATVEDAEEQMWVQATIHRKGVRADQAGEWLARQVRRDLWERDHTRPTGEVLYTHWQPECSSVWESTPYPVVKKTPTRVYVRYDEGLVIVDRRELEAEGRFYSRSAHTAFYTQPYEVRHAERLAEERRQAAAREAERIDRLAGVTEAELDAAAEFCRRGGVHLDPLEAVLILRALPSLMNRPADDTAA